MGTGQSSRAELEAELARPLDASDVTSREEAVAEVSRLRGILAKYAESSSKYNAEKSTNNNYLGWRREALAKPSAPTMESRSKVLNSELSTECAELMRQVLNSLKEGVFLEDGPPIPLLMSPEADWSGFVPYLLSRVAAGNALGGPRMRVVWHGTLKAIGHLPRWPQEHEHILDLETLCKEWIKRQDGKGKIDGRAMCVSLFSHRWDRPSLDSSEAHPDTRENSKAKALTRYGESGTCPIFHPHHTFEYFFWVDFAGINQDDHREKWLGISKLPAYISSCVEMIFYFTDSYEARAWTRMERCISYVYVMSPLFVFINADYASATSRLPIDELVSRYDCFTKDETTGGLLLEVKDPLAEDASLTDPEDKVLIRNLLHILKQATPLCPAMKAVMAASATSTKQANDNDEEGEKVASAYLKFGQTCMPVDTEHWALDCIKNRRILEKRKETALPTN